VEKAVENMWEKRETVENNFLKMSFPQFPQAIHRGGSGKPS
jgi:hypothetical protein